MTERSFKGLTCESVPSYIAARPNLADLVDADDLTVREVGDGNINLVFIVKDGQGRGLCLKQAPPYVRRFGEGWSLTPDRIEAEALAYEAAMLHDPGAAPLLHGIDSDEKVLAVEDLSSWTVWRTALNEGESHPGAAARLGQYVARMALGTGIFGDEGGPEFRASAARWINPELCQITEELVFTEPFVDRPRNTFAPGLAATVAAIRSDAAAMSRVQELRHRFRTCGESLIHGDLHTGSVMVSSTGTNSTAKAFDAEFAFYGPVGFDLGALFANYLIARARAAVLDRPSEFRSHLDGLTAETIESFCAEVGAGWAETAAGPGLAEWRERWLEQILADAVGFAAVKAIRRIVGWAKTTDIESLDAPERREAAASVLRTAHAWLSAPSGALAPERAREILEPLR